MTIVQFDAERATRNIQELDLGYIETRLMRFEGLTAEQAREATTCYRQLLTLQVEHPDQRLAPPVSADRALHAHILHTRRYAEDTRAIFGSFLHHDPEESNEQVRDFTRKCFLERFGITVEAFAICWVGIENKLAA